MDQLKIRIVFLKPQMLNSSSSFFDPEKHNGMLEFRKARFLMTKKSSGV